MARHLAIELPGDAILARISLAGMHRMAVQPLKKGKSVRDQVSKEEWQKRVELT